MNSRFEIHSIATVFPEMPANEFAELKEDIFENGVRQPAILFEGKIADGRSRYAAWSELLAEGKGVSEFPTSVFAGDEESLLKYVWSANVTRRHLDASQRAMLAAKMASRFEELAKARQQAGGLASVEAKGKSATMAAELSGASRASTERAIAVHKQGDASLSHAVADGTVTVSDAAKIVDQPKAVQRAAVQAVKAGRVKTVTAAVAANQKTTVTTGSSEQAQPLDEIGAPLPARLVPIFEDGQRLAEAERHLSQARKIIKEVGEAQAGAYLHVERIVTEITNAKNAIKLSKPYAVCASCGGKGCRGCKSRCGFLSKAVHERTADGDVQAQTARPGEVDTEELAEPYRCALNSINKILREFKAISERKRLGGHLAHAYGRIRKGLEDAKAPIAQMAPVEVCSYCHGDREDCKRCMGTGFFTKAIVDSRGKESSAAA